MVRSHSTTFLHHSVIILLLVTAACTTTRVPVAVPDVAGADLQRADIAPDTLTARMPDFTGTLNALKGRGRAIVSEPGNSERVTVHFSGNRQKSRVTIKNGLGIEGGEIFSEGDSMLIYNKVDKIARKVSVGDEHLTSVSHLASVNIVEMMNFTVRSRQVASVYESDQSYLLLLDSGGEVYLDRNSYTVQQVNQPLRSGAPYSRIIYEAYGEIEGYILPRRVTIFSMDGSAKVTLLIQSLEINPEDLDLSIELPEDVKLVTQ